MRSYFENIFENNKLITKGNRTHGEKKTLKLVRHFGMHYFQMYET